MTYTDTCTVTAYEKYKKSNKTTAFRDVVKYSDIPCRLSFQSKNAASKANPFSGMTQSIKLFVAPDVEISPGSKITVTHDGRTTEYKQSGFPAVYATHQEILLELLDERA